MNEIEDNYNKKLEFRGLVFFSALIVVILGLTIYKNYTLKEKGVYVIGKLQRSFYAGSETGWINTFTYFYMDNKYNVDIGASRNERIPADSFIYIKIHKHNRIFYQGIFNRALPSCITSLYEKGLYWDTIPDCP